MVNGVFDTINRKVSKVGLETVEVMLFGLDLSIEEFAFDGGYKDIIRCRWLTDMLVDSE